MKNSPFIQKDSRGYRVSYAFQDLTSCPVFKEERMLHLIYALDLSHNLISNVANLSKYPSLQELVLDSNTITHFIDLPQMPYLELLWVNDNLISNLTVFVERVALAAPNLKLLSMLKNLACPNYFVEGGSPQQYKDYRRFVIQRIPTLVVLDDVEISDEEKENAMKEREARLHNPFDADMEARRRQVLNRAAATTEVVENTTNVHTVPVVVEKPSPVTQPSVVINQVPEVKRKVGEEENDWTSGDDDDKTCEKKQPRPKKQPVRKDEDVSVPPKQPKVSAIVVPEEKVEETPSEPEGTEEVQSAPEVEEAPREPETEETSPLPDLPAFDPEAPIEWHQPNSTGQNAETADDDKWSDSEDEADKPAKTQRKSRPKKGDSLVEELKRRLRKQAGRNIE